MTTVDNAGDEHTPSLVTDNPRSAPSAAEDKRCGTCRMSHVTFDLRGFCCPDVKMDLPFWVRKHFVGNHEGIDCPIWEQWNGHYD